jgi:hypothetical protein
MVIKISTFNPFHATNETAQSKVPAISAMKNSVYK